MALRGDHYRGTYEGHTLELVRNNWNKTLKLFIDGQEVASTSCMFPGHFTLTGSLEHDGVRHAVVAESIPYHVVMTKDRIAVDGSDLPLAYEKPLGLLRGVFKGAWRGDLLSIIAVGAVAVTLLALLIAGSAVLWEALR
jgi:hypothetical protein